MATTKVNVSKISDFPKVTTLAGSEQILVEKDGQGGSITLSQIPVSTPVNDKITEEVNKLNSQINDLAFEPGDTTGDAELRNIRTPADGFTVPPGSNAGQAVRAQVTQLDNKISDLKGDLSELGSELNDIMIISSNALNSADLQMDKAVDGSGNIVDNVGTVLSPLINITNGYIVASRRTPNGDIQYGVQAISLYKDGIFIKRFRSINTPYQITDNANQVRVTFHGGSTEYFIGFTDTNEVMEYEDYYKTINPDKIADTNPFKGLSAVAFGTSLTARAYEDHKYDGTTYGYLTYLRQYSGMEIDNQGIGGATILSDSVTKSIYTQIMNYTDYVNKDVCIIEGFVNDWFKNSENTLGTYTDNGTDTVCGRVRNAVSHILTQNPNITIFAILDHYGKNDGTTSHASTEIVNSNTQYSYYEEIAKVFESIGVIVIKEYVISGISELAPQYLADYIHVNDLGARQSANTIWSGMKRYTPKVIN